MVKEEEPKCAVALINPPGLGVNQIANVLIYEKKPGQDPVPFPDGQMFDVQVIEGSEFIDLISASGDTSDILENVPLPLKLITRNALGVSVKIAASVHMTQVMRAMHMRAVQMLAGVAGNGTNGVLEDNSSVCDLPGVIKIENEEILLGETKYYRTRFSESGVFYIEPSGPTLGEGISEDVWRDGANPPVYKISGPTGGLPVYWEKQYPIWSGNTFAGMADLPAGVIRIVGRYWNNDGSYICGLTATKGDKNAAVTIEVKESRQFGTGNGTIKDVFNADLNVDNLLLNQAGKGGIPPQLIKGQMEKETNFRNSYRYEPWTDIRIQRNQDDRSWYFGANRRFVVAATTMGTGATIPTGHINVLPLPYPTAPTTIRDYMGSNAEEYVVRSEMKFLNDKDLTDQLQENYRLTRRFVQGFSESQAKQAALIRTKDEILNGVVGNTENYDRIAQTRIVASYGLIQMTHYTATDNSLNNFTKTSDTRAPEFLNDHNFGMPAHREFIIKKLKMALRTSAVPEHSWQMGYEAAWLEAFQSYNRNEKTYAQDVFRLSRNYLPRR